MLEKLRVYRVFPYFQGLYAELETGLTKIPEIADVGEPGTQCLLPIFLPKRPRLDIIHEHNDNPRAQTLVLQTIRTPETRNRLLDQIRPDTSSLFRESNTPLMRYSEYRRINHLPSLQERFGFNENARGTYEDDEEETRLLSSIV